MKKESILKHTRAIIDSILEKSSFNVGKVPILHRAIHDYLSVADPAKCQDMIELLKDHLVHMLHTREGARVAQFCILHCGPKDRKQIVKSFKGFVYSIAKEQYGYAVLLSCFECIDDTVLVGKALIGELFTPASPEHSINELLRDPWGSKVILFLLCGRNRRYQPSFIIQELEEMDVVRATTTKKEPEARHQQLLEVTSPLLIKEVAKYADELLRDKAGSLVLVETCHKALGEVSPILDAVLDLVKTSTQSDLKMPEVAEEVVNVVKKMKAERDLQRKKDQGLDMDESLLISRSGTFTLKNMLAKAKEGEVPIWKSSFAKSAWEILKPEFIKLIKHCSEHPTATAGLAFIFVALYENGDEKVQADMKKTIKKDLKAFESKITEKGSNQKSTDKKRKRKETDEPYKTGLEILFNLLH
jgi:pumilio family protein 6